MTRNLANLLCYLLILATVATAAWLYPALPDPMPAPWNFDGESDARISKPWGVAILPGCAILVFIVFRTLSRRMPGRTLNALQVAFVALSCCGALVALFSAYP